MSTHNAHIEYIPLNKLSVSKLNVRKKDRKADIEMLAASIAAHGLLQNLAVVPNEAGRYDVVAGGRRLAALKLLSGKGEIARDFAVPCHVTRPEDAGEASLAENIQRAAMDVMDEVEAFAALAGQGKGAEDIARRFGCGRRQVEQRLALARLSSKLKAAYRRGDLSLDAARAFCITDDQDQQEAVFKALGKHVMHASSVRNHLMSGAMRANDRIARFVGLEPYEAAGGRVRRDLFQESEAYITDPGLMTRLAEERLQTARQDLIESGWGWATVNLSPNRLETYTAERLYPSRRQMTDQESAAAEALETEEEKLNEALEDADEDDPRWRVLDDLDAQRHALFEACKEWDEALKPLAGVVIALSPDGRPEFSYGHVAKSDSAKVRRLRKEREATAVNEQGGDSGDPIEDSATGYIKLAAGSFSDLSKALTREVTAARTRIVRWKLSQSPHLALALTFFVMSRGIAHHQRLPGMELSVSQINLDDSEQFLMARAGILEAIPSAFDEGLDWCLSQSTERLLQGLAVILAGTLDLHHEGASQDDARKQCLADGLCSALDIDMRDHWRPDEAYWARLPKATIIGALLDEADHDGERAAVEKTYAKRPKDDLVQMAVKALTASGYLPDILVTPIARGGYVLSDSGANAIAAE